VLELEMVRDGLQEKQKEEEREKMQREQGEFNKFLDEIDSKKLAILNQERRFVLELERVRDGLQEKQKEEEREKMRHKRGEQWELVRDGKKD
jgi:hypothetical protein